MIIDIVKICPKFRNNKWALKKVKFCMKPNFKLFENVYSQIECLSKPNSRIPSFQHKQIINYKTPNTVNILRITRYNFIYRVFHKKQFLTMTLPCGQIWWFWYHFCQKVFKKDQNLILLKDRWQKTRSWLFNLYLKITLISLNSE